MTGKKAVTLITLPRVVYPGGLSQREHALWQAHQWQLKMIEEHSTELAIPEPYAIIVDLLGLCRVSHATWLRIQKKLERAAGEAQP